MNYEFWTVNYLNTWFLITCPATPAAATDPYPPFSTITATAISGLSYGANPMNHEWGTAFCPFGRI